MWLKTVCEKVDKFLLQILFLNRLILLLFDETFSVGIEDSGLRNKT